MADWDNESWKAMFKDDYFYAANLSGIFYTKWESRLNEIILIDFGFDKIYQIYHVFSFSIGLLIKFFTEIQSYFIFNFFIIPFFQLFCFSGLFSIGLFLRSSITKSLLTSLFVISSLRYSTIDELIFETLNLRLFSKSVVLQNFYGTQLLNSGFGLKFCIALGLVSILVINLENSKVLSKTFFFAIINPLYLLISCYFSLFIIIFKRNFTKKLFFNTTIILLALLFFTKLQNQRNYNLDINEVLNQVSIVLNTSIKRVYFIVIGDIFNNYYMIFLLPSIFILIFEKVFYLRLMSIMFIIFPLYEIIGNKFYFSSLFLILSTAIHVYFIFKNFKQKYIFIFYILLLLNFALTLFSHIYIDINQIFMFVNFSFTYILSFLILNKYAKNMMIYTISFLTLILFNLYHNFEENKVRAIELSEKKENQEISNWCSKIRKRKINYMGIYDKKMSYQFNNQFWEGEEWFIENDQLIPTPASVPGFSTSYRNNSEYLKELFPIWKFGEKYKPADTTAEFLKFYKIPILIVKNIDLKEAESSTSLYSKSMVNTRLDYTVFYDLKPEYNKIQ